MIKIEQFYKGKLVPPPVYEFKEYPKWVKKDDGTDVLVHSTEEEASHAPKPKRGRPKNDSTTANDPLGHNFAGAENS
jgi:hypothetical protein